MQFQPSILAITLCGIGLSAVGQEPKPTKIDSHAVARKTAMDIKATRLVDGESVALEVGRDPLLSYQTVIRGWSKGSAWVWGNRGRPQAMLSLVTLEGSRTRYYEFLSFSTNKLIFKIPGGPTWIPEPTWKAASIPKTKRPANARRLRLIQMRDIARRFSAFQRDYFEDPQKGVRHEMRLLTQPIYRYRSESNESLDGAFFAFTRNGDLELLLVLEAEKSDSNQSAPWVYSAYPVTIHELNLLLDGTRVWFLQNKRISDVQSATEKYFIFRRRATDDELPKAASQ